MELNLKNKTTKTQQKLQQKPTQKKKTTEKPQHTARGNCLIWIQMHETRASKSTMQQLTLGWWNT